MGTEDLIKLIIDCAFEVKRSLGTGFLETVYQNALIHELKLKGIITEKEVTLNVVYKGVNVGKYRADLIVDHRVIVELKVCDTIIPAHEYQLVNYLRATGIPDGLILNFGTTPMGICRKFKDKKQARNY
ncbi:GxxExxY protein [uncultured Duncaniella sp.]|uniref:GxxExxY protein n=1 Tax=uncultured Duncaniella sp. TaxID=2768039 RepID=UPI002633D885|nr:GxxExxY protein [uncultured Duncaniella sp.]